MRRDGFGRQEIVHLLKAWRTGKKNGKEAEVWAQESRITANFI